MKNFLDDNELINKPHYDKIEEFEPVNIEYYFDLNS